MAAPSSSTPGTSTVSNSEGSHRAQAATILLIGVVCMSTGSLFARFASPTPAISISFWRCAVSTLVLLPYALPGLLREFRTLSRRDRWLAVASGFFLALHFQTWIASLELTTVAASSILVGTVPVWVALLSPRFTNDRVDPRIWGAIALCLAGSSVIAWGDFSTDLEALKGDGLALIGAITAGFYLLCGRGLRPKLSLPTYLLATYGSASLWLGAGCWLQAVNPFEVPDPAWKWLILLGLVPQLLGHSSLNWALRWLSAGLVALTVLAEPILASLWAFLFLNEDPSWRVAAGGSLLLLGILFATTLESASNKDKQAEERGT